MLKAELKLRPTAGSGAEAPPYGGKAELKLRSTAGMS
jgi:hypothetical protein